MLKQRTFFEKVWDDHFIADLGENVSLVQVDRFMLHDQGGTALRKLIKSGRQPAFPQQVFTVVDHVIATRPGRSLDELPYGGGSEMIRTMRQLSREYGFTCFDAGTPGQGIIHVVSPEQGLALPGLTLACPDSHTCTVGGVGALGWAVSAGEGEHILATQTMPLFRPKTMRVTIDGRLAKGVSAKDVVLYLIGQVGANGGIGYAVEFTGPVVAAMPIEGRLTLCNMAIDFSANFGFVPPDDATIEYLAGRPYAPTGPAWDAAVVSWRQLPSDPGAMFDRDFSIDGSAIAPQVSWGTSLEHVMAIDGLVPDPATLADQSARDLCAKALDYIQLTPGTPVAGVPIDGAYIGSCTNSRLSDLRDAAAVLKGRKVAEGVQAVCVPGSTQVKAAAEAEGLDRIFLDAGFEWHESGCGMCSSDGGLRFTDQRVISTTNRNFESRQGPRTRTHLASPATVAASAVVGYIADSRRLSSEEGGA